MKKFEEFVNEGRYVNIDSIMRKHKAMKAKASGENAGVKKLEKTVAELKKQNEDLKLENKRLRKELNDTIDAFNDLYDE